MLDSRRAVTSSLDSPRAGESTRVHFPILRWVALGWLTVWIPAYWHAWGWQNFLHLCDIAVILSCLGIIFQNRLLISSQALATVVPGIIWSMDAGWRLVLHHHLIGGTEYLWDSTQPLWIRLLSLFHIVLPILLVALCAAVGYDRRALVLQSAITIGLLVISRWMGAAANLNYTFIDPIFHRALGPAPIHVAIIFVGTLVLFYLPAHAFLGWRFSRGDETSRTR